MFNDIRHFILIATHLVTIYSPYCVVLYAGLVLTPPGSVAKDVAAVVVVLGGGAGVVVVVVVVVVVLGYCVVGSGGSVGGSAVPAVVNTGPAVGTTAGISAVVV